MGRDLLFTVLMSVYLDTNVFIFASLGDEGDIRTQKARELLQRIIEGKETGHTSLLAIDEFVWTVIKQKKDRKTAIEQGLRLHTLPIHFIPLITSISLRALHLMQRYQISPRDALHASSCMEVKATGLVTDDSDFDQIKEVKRLKLQ